MKIPVYKPHLAKNTANYVSECLDSTWISSRGEYLSKFENEFSRFLNIAHSTTVTNGTVALHLALLGLEIGSGDEVIVPTMTYIASVNAIAYVGASPVFIDADSDSWNIDVSLIEKSITKKTKAILAVHIYGNPCRLDELQKLCKNYNLLLIEDTAEAFGSKYKDQFVGSFGDVATFSFFGNKTISTGEGGMVASNSKRIIDRVSYFKNQAVSLDREYWHDEIGFNYRMTNICAAIGLAQIEVIEPILLKKQRIALWYQDALKDYPVSFQNCENNSFNSYWMVSILTPSISDRDNLRNHLKKSEVETRPLFHPAHTMPVFHSDKCYPVAEDLSARGLNLPSYPDLTKEEVSFICNEIKTFFNN